MMTVSINDALKFETMKVLPEMTPAWKNLC